MQAVEIFRALCGAGVGKLRSLCRPRDAGARIDCDPDTVPERIGENEPRATTLITELGIAPPTPLGSDGLVDPA